MSEMIQLEKASLFYDTGISIRNLDLRIDKDEFVYLFGPSGAGKSSILALIYMELIPNSGAVRVFEVETTGLRRKYVAQLRKRIGMMFQEPKLLNDRDIYSNLALPLEIAGHASKAVRQRVFQKADEMDLRSRLNHFPLELSGGERQRVALAQASIHSPELLLVDEPTAHLDDESAKTIVDTLWKLHESGVGVLFATHNETILKKDPARTISLDKGEIIQDRPR